MNVAGHVLCMYSAHSIVQYEVDTDPIAPTPLHALDAVLPWV